MKKSVIEIYSVNYMSKEATCYRLLIALNRLTRASHKQHLTKAYNRVFADLPKTETNPRKKPNWKDEETGPQRKKKRILQKKN